MTETQTALSLLDLRTGRLALLRPDRETYAASLAKIGILLAYFDAHPEAATKIDPTVEKELGQMAKISSNEMAAKYSRELGLKNIQHVLTDKYHLYDPTHGGGIWLGKHYGKGEERYPSPVSDNSHAATVRQVMRFFLMLEQGQLVSPDASKEMRKIFESPTLKHDNNKFVKALANRDVQIIRKWGTWENWHHDAAVVTAPDRHYLLVALTEHPKGDDYLEALAKTIDDLMTAEKN